MAKALTSDDYSRRLQRVVAHLTAHLDDEVDLAALAEIACFSPHHFHRIYRACMGETVRDTVARLRLARAATDLARSTKPVSEVAGRAGYGSLAAFNHAFSSTYGQSPTLFRRKGAVRLEGRHLTERGTLPMPITIEDREPMRIAAIEHLGPHAEVGRTFQKLIAWAGPRGLLGAAARGVTLYPGAQEDKDAEARAIVGVTVTANCVGDDVVSILKVPGGRHAVATHRGPYARLPDSYDALFAWLPPSGEAPGDAPLFEVNLNDPRDTPPQELLTEICLPLQPPARILRKGLPPGSGR